jgi:hypothetical protein
VATVFSSLPIGFSCYVLMCLQVCLDGQKANSRELDTVAVRVAMHKSHELKSAIAGSKSKRKVCFLSVFRHNIKVASSKEGCPLIDDRSPHMSLLHIYFISYAIFVFSI